MFNRPLRAGTKSRRSDDTGRATFEFGVTSLEDHDMMPAVSKLIESKLDTIYKRNPDTYLDAVESRWEDVCMDVAKELGGKVDFDPKTVEATFHFTQFPYGGQR